MQLKIEKKGGGLPLLAAALSACPADCHPGLDPLDPGGQHLATCCLVRMATKVGSPFLLASKTSFCTPSPRWFHPLKPPDVTPDLFRGHWPRASPDECSLSGQAFAVAFFLDIITPNGHLTPTASAASLGHGKMQAFCHDARLARYLNTARFLFKICG